MLQEELQELEGLELWQVETAGGLTLGVVERRAYFVSLLACKSPRATSNMLETAGATMKECSSSHMSAQVAITTKNVW